MKHRTLRVQPLELRALLAIDVSLDLLTGDLNIMGSTTDDVVEISGNALLVNARVTEAGVVSNYSYARPLVRTLTVRGGDGDDLIVNGTDLPATLLGQNGNDTLNGGSGDDVLRGGDGDDLLRGGAGNDLLSGDAGQDEIYGNEGDDRVSGGDGDDRLRGGAGNDSMFGDNGRDQLYGEAGDDTLIGSELKDYLYGGTGNDILRGGDGNDVLRGEDGDDQLYGDAGNDFLRGDAGKDALTGDVGDDQLYGGVGDDALDGGTGDDSLWGEDGDDRLLGREGNDVLYGGLGNDDVRGDAGLNRIYGDDGNDTLIGGPDAEQIWGGAGNDLLRGYGGDDALFGEDGLDTLYGDDGDDALDGGDDDDALYGDAGDDTLDGGAGNDLLQGSLGNDVLRGGDDDDTIWAGAGNDQLFGGAGNDSLNGDDGNDTIRGDAGNDVIASGAGNDNVNGSDGDDQISGGDGDDELMGGPDNDVIHGGAGDDHLRGLDGDDNLYGDEGSDILVGGAGLDTIYGGADTDLLIGGEGVDRLWGNAGSDLLIGGITVYDDSAGQLRAVLSAWSGSIIYQGFTSTNYVSNKSVTLRPSDTVLDDGAEDSLEGDTDWDSFFWFNADSLGDRALDEPVASGDVSDTGWVKRVYLDLFAALPTDAQLASLLTRLGNGVSRASITRELLSTNEFRAEQLRRVYRQTFGADIDSGALTLQLLAWGPATEIEQIWAGYLASPEFYAAHGGADASVIQAMFNVVVRRTASAGEIGAWLETLAGTSLKEVAQQIVTSYEVQSARVTEWYREYLHRAPLAPQLTNRIQQLDDGATSDDVRIALLTSAEYLNQPYFDIADFGATADDDIEDSTAVQTALNMADLAGNSVVYVGPGVYIVDNLRLAGSNLKLIGPGTLKLKDLSPSVGVLSVDGDYNVLEYLKIDGNKTGQHTGRAEGLRLVGDFNRVFRVDVLGTYSNEIGEASGQNFVAIGSYNTLIETRSLNAGHSGYRQIGEGTYYRDIVSLNYRVKGFNGSGNGTSFTVDGGYFETDAPEHWLGVNSFQVDPGPGKLLNTVILRNVTALGPRNSTGVTTAAAKFALINDVIIENSSFISTAENHSSLRFAEGIGDVILRNVHMSRNLFMQQETHDGSGLDDPMESLLMENCTIGDGIHHPVFAMERVRVGKLTIKDSKFYGYTLAAIDWQSPETEYSRIEAIDTLFRGYNATRVTYDIYPRNGGELLDPSKRLWKGIRRRNSGGGGQALMP